MGIPSLASFMYKRAEGPSIASISPEHAQFNEGLKAEALRKLLRLGLMGAAGGAGVGLLSHFLGKHQIKTPEADEPDIDLPYPQLKKMGMDPLHLAASATPLVSTGIGAAAGSLRNPNDPLAGAFHGGAKGLGTGLVGAGGYMAANKLASKLLGGRDDWTALVARMLMRGVGTSSGLFAGNQAMNMLDKKADWADSLAHTVMPTTPGSPMPSVGSLPWFRGDSHTNVQSMPWVIPGALAAGLGGLYGGNKLVRHLLERKRKSDLNSELDQAKKDYEEAMMSQYDPNKIRSLDSKAASAPENRLDKVFGILEKRGLDFNNLLGAGTGGYLGMASLLAGGMGVGTYKYLEGRSKAKLLADALKQRALLRGLSNPPEVFLHPVPAHLHHTDKGDEVEENKISDPTKN